jgi:hypothetical protein
MSKQATQPQVTDVSTRIIALANQIKDEGVDVKLISSALMQASAIYATYAAAGNAGYLQESGVQKVADAYRNGLAALQEIKRAGLEAQGLKPTEKTAPMPLARPEE